MNSMGFIFGALIAVLILFYAIGRLVDSKRSGMLEQYELIRKRFGFELKRFGSKWGWGIGEHYVLEGAYRGYPVRVYEHFHEGNGPKQYWTSMTFELLITGGLELIIEAGGTEEKARYQRIHSVQKTRDTLTELLGISMYQNDPNWTELIFEKDQIERVKRFFSKESLGAIRLSKGFLEYRESGILRESEMRIRYQDAILVLADLADAFSAHKNKDHWEALFEE